MTEAFSFVLDHFAPVHEAWLSWIEPGGFVLPHRDAGPWRERWQVPIQTSGRFTFGSGEVGVPLEVRHWEKHAVWNTGDRPRIHLVLDRAVTVDRRPEAFRTFAIPAPYTPLVEAAMKET